MNKIGVKREMRGIERWVFLIGLILAGVACEVPVDEGRTEQDSLRSGQVSQSSPVPTASLSEREQPTATPAAALPENPLYVLAGGHYFTHDQTVTALTIVDPQTWTIHKTVDLPQLLASPMALDSQGRIWIGFGLTKYRAGKEVHLYDQAGNLLHKLETCFSPKGISFAAGRAFVACEENGFYGRVDVFDLATLERVKTLELQPLADSDVHIILTIAADENYVLVVAQTDRSPDYKGPSTTIDLLTLINPHTLEIATRSERLHETGIDKILPYQGKFYLLNYVSFRRAYERVQVGMGLNALDHYERDYERRRLAQYEANDLLIVSIPEEGGPLQIEERALPLNSPDMSPKWGTLDGDELYALQDDHSLFNPTPELGITRLNLKTGAVESWALPEHQGDLKDIAIVNGQIIVTLFRNGSGGREDEGLYVFDPGTETLNQVLQVDGATKLLTLPN